jgi:voltage-gated potassium channel
MKINPVRLFWKVVRHCHFDRLLAGFLLVFFLGGLVITLSEPSVQHYMDSLWYLFVACTTIGFGDITPVTFPGRAVTILITFYEIVLVAILSGVVVSFYLELINRRDKDTLTAFLDRVEHVSELSREELLQMEENVRKFRK